MGEEYERLRVRVQVPRDIVSLYTLLPFCWSCAHALVIHTSATATATILALAYFLLFSRSHFEPLHLSCLQFPQILFRDMHATSQVAHLVHFDILSLLANPLLYVLLFQLGSAHRSLPELRICWLMSTQEKVKRRPHGNELNTWYALPRGE